MIRTPRGLVHESIFMPFGGLIVPRKSEAEKVSQPLPADVGSRIGVVYMPTTSEDKADMFFIVNGVLQGPILTDIPYRDNPMFAVVDVYGSTRSVRVVQCDNTGMKPPLT